MKWKRIVLIGLCLVLALGLSVSTGICQQTKETDEKKPVSTEQTKSPGTKETKPADKAKMESDKSPKPWENEGKETKSGRFNPKEGC